MNKELIPINKNDLYSINARNIWKYLEIKKKFANWIRNSLKRGEFEENKDYKVIKVDLNSIKGGRPRRDYFLKIEVAIFICFISIKFYDKGIILYKYLQDYIRKEKGYLFSPEYFLVKRRFEIEVVDLLKKSFKDILEIKTQYRVLSYYLDVYIPELHLAIEIDERDTHKNKEDFDNEREKEIKEDFGCEFYRMEDNKEKIGELINFIQKKYIRLKS